MHGTLSRQPRNTRPRILAWLQYRSVQMAMIGLLLGRVTSLLLTVSISNSTTSVTVIGRVCLNHSAISYFVPSLLTRASRRRKTASWCPVMVPCQCKEVTRWHGKLARLNALVVNVREVKKGTVPGMKPGPHTCNCPRLEFLKGTVVKTDCR